MTPRFAATHVLVTGAAGAIGAAIARALRAAWPEVSLALLDRDAAALEPLARELRVTSDNADAPATRDDHTRAAATDARDDHTRAAATDARDDHTRAAATATRGDHTRAEAATRGDHTRAAATATRGDHTRAEAATRGDHTRADATATRGDPKRAGATATRGDHTRAGATATRGDHTRAEAATRDDPAARRDDHVRSRGGCSTHVVDLRDVDALPAVVAEIERGGGPLDGLVNCAGVMRVQALPTWQWNDARDLVAIDLLAPLRLQDLVARGIVARGGGGVIVNVSSMAGKVPLRGCTYYGAAKAGIAMASEIARADLAPHGVRVVTVYPGPVTSALEQGARDAYGGGGLAGKLAPTGDPATLAAKIVRAIDRDDPRVIYPRAYGVGFTAPNLSRWIALSYGPPPVR